MTLFVVKKILIVFQHIKNSIFVKKNLFLAKNGIPIIPLFLKMLT
jgi:hypothetical protein